MKGVNCLIIMEEDRQEERNLDEVELQHFGHQLLNLTNFYQQFIPIESPEIQQKLDVLHNIGTAIVRRDYHMILNDPTVVNGNKNGLTLKEYQQLLYEELCDQFFQGKPF